MMERLRLSDLRNEDARDFISRFSKKMTPNILALDWETGLSSIVLMAPKNHLFHWGGVPQLAFSLICEDEFPETKKIELRRKLKAAEFHIHGCLLGISGGPKKSDEATDMALQRSRAFLCRRENTSLVCDRAQRYHELTRQWECISDNGESGLIHEQYVNLSDDELLLKDEWLPPHIPLAERKNRQHHTIRLLEEAVGCRKKAKNHQLNVRPYIYLNGSVSFCHTGFLSSVSREHRINELRSRLLNEISNPVFYRNSKDFCDNATSGLFGRLGMSKSVPKDLVEFCHSARAKYESIAKQLIK